MGDELKQTERSEEKERHCREREDDADEQRRHHRATGFLLGGLASLILFVTVRGRQDLVLRDLALLGGRHRRSWIALRRRGTSAHDENEDEQNRSANPTASSRHGERYMCVS